jgi:light-regulated signal transduction histidine kinase (bacteriophytochrome)
MPDSIKEIIDPIRTSLKQLYPNSEITLKTNGQLFSSRTNLTILFQNLIENGIKYNKSGIKRIELDFHEQETQNVITVKDNGIGIPDEYQNQIFKLFSRLHSDGEFEGTGIGLSTCKKIVEEHLNGELTLSSNPNEGTTFRIDIPIERSN